MKKIILKYITFLAIYGSFLINLPAQCANENHSTHPQDSWLSCSSSTNPNPDRGNSHWLRYDLGYIYHLTSTQFWNYNVADATNKGFKNIAIDYSTDGITWSNATTFELAQAPGTNDYTGVAGPDLSGLAARYILLTALDTWGNSCAGLSEVKFDVDNSLDIFLKQFSATCEGTSIQLNWQAVEEQNHDFFTIEKSEDGLTWESVDEVYSQGQSPQISHYEWTDDDLHFNQNSTYYRLVSTDSDGKTNTSPTVLLENCGTDSSIDFTIYPNPAIHNIKIASNNLKMKEFLIHNAIGQEIYRIAAPDFSGMIDISDLPSGLYFLTALTKNQGQLISKQFSVVRGQ